MKHRITVQVPVEKRGLFGHRKIVYEKRTILVDGKMYRRMMKKQQNQGTDDFLSFVDKMETFDAIFDE